MKNLFAKFRGLPCAIWFGVFGVGLLVAGCQTNNERIIFSSVPGEEQFTGDSPAEGARIARGDTIKVTFSGVPVQIQPHEEQVKDDGTITMPYIGTIQAEGKTAGELQRDIHDWYVPAYYKRLTVTVTTDRQVYFVSGQVRSPNRQAYIGPTTVLRAINSAGDFTDFADRKRVILTRPDGTRIEVDCLKAAKDSTYDLPVYPGDKIEVPMRVLPFGL